MKQTKLKFAISSNLLDSMKFLTLFVKFKGIAVGKKLFFFLLYINFKHISEPKNIFLLLSEHSRSKIFRTLSTVTKIITV